MNNAEYLFLSVVALVAAIFAVINLMKSICSKCASPMDVSIVLANTMVYAIITWDWLIRSH